MSFAKEFRSFAIKGNVVDLAVGVIIGGAFGGIVGSLVGDIIMPVIGVLTGGVDFSGLAVKVGAATVAYGKFIQAIFTFIIIAFSLFLIVKAVNKMKKEEAPAAPQPDPGPSSTDKLLMEIRDALKK